ncbi:MAG: hypothetical protein MI861_25175, partial [Pirellulales bacterium]|nr:hypothetical protein [Pirellulales bacterium]
MMVRGNVRSRMNHRRRRLLVETLENRRLLAGPDDPDYDGDYGNNDPYVDSGPSDPGGDPASGGSSDPYGGGDPGSGGDSDPYGGGDPGSGGDPDPYGGGDPGSGGDPDPYGGGDPGSGGDPDPYGGGSGLGSEKFDWQVINAIQFANETGEGEPSENLQFHRDLYDDATNRIHFAADLTTISNTLVNGIEQDGAEITVNPLTFAPGGELTFVEGWATPEQLESIGSRPEVIQIRGVSYAVADTGTVTSAGEGILLADRAETVLGMTGAGVRVGVISDGANRRGEIDGNNLPGTITVHPTLTGQGPNRNQGDEGTAMLEIVHDLAPGANLYFAAPTTQGEMIQAMRWMVDQNVDVVVDDLTFFDQPFFVDGPLAVEARRVTQQDITYVSSAGNDATSHYQGVWNPNGNSHDFGGGVIDLPLTLPRRADPNVPSQTFFLMQWSDDWQ